MQKMLTPLRHIEPMESKAADKVSANRAIAATNYRAS